MTEVRKRVLVVEDEPDVRRTLDKVLTLAGFTVLLAADGRTGLRAVHAEKPDALVLDIGLPGLDGWQVLARVRDLSDVPVLLLTAHGAEAEKVRGLRAGADDYLTKPYGNAELVARVHALLRRATAAGSAPEVYDDGQVRLDPSARTVLVDGADIRLSPTEFRLLAVLARNSGQVLTPNQLLDRVWGDPTGIGPERVKFAVLRLRRRLGWADPESSPIQSVRGIGYRYRPSA
ncbi:MAG TPA: response regulator transcription factor [Mycobacteriales bacterium]|nr:response regulator transcription factor [Mycobacteriales bacterium]